MVVTKGGIMKSEMQCVQKLGRAYLYSRLPQHHKFAISSCAPHGEPEVINALQGIGYSWKTARQLYLAYKEQQQAQNET